MNEGTNGKELRKNGSYILCLFLTAHAKFDYARKAMELNGIDYILKHYSIDDMARTIAFAIQLFVPASPFIGFRILC